MPILTYINNVPLFSKVEEARVYGQARGLQGFHTHVHNGIKGFMAGRFHTESINEQEQRIQQQEVLETQSIIERLDIERLDEIETPILKKINNISIDTSDMSSLDNTREIIVSGDVGAEFSIVIIDNSNKFYDFETGTFSLGNTNNKNLNVKLQNNNFEQNVFFPAASGGATYKIIVITKNPNTELEGFSNKNVFNADITQVADTTLTFVGNTSTSNYQSMPTTTSTGSPVLDATQNVSINLEFKNATSDSAGFGLRLIRQPVDTDFFFLNTETVNGAITSSTKVIVDSLTDIGVGTTITAVSSGSLSGTPIITEIDTNTKTLTLSSAQTFADGITLTLKSFGSSSIQKAIGCDLDFNNLIAFSAPLTKTVRTTATGTTVNLNGTYGISGGNHVSVTGPFIRYNDGENTVSSVSASSTAGSIVMNSSQTVKVGTVLTFKGSTETVTLRGGVAVNRFPRTNRTINIILDNFITVGIEN